MTLTINTLKRMNKMALSKDARAWLDEQSNAFKVPVAEEFDHYEALEFLLESSADWAREQEDLGGWYARLSAPGYLDATDWHGPFESEDEALESLYELYGDH